jgi:hypothetical protein
MHMFTVNPLIVTGVTPAEKILNMYENKGQHNVEPDF